MSNYYRYAVYYTPRADEPLAEFGRRWLGFDTETRAPVPDAWPMPSGIIRTPARYGFHATLKAPFRLRDNKTPEALMAAVEALAATRAPVPLGQLAPRELGGFMTLQQTLPNPEVDDLAFACVRDLDPFRRPFSDAEQDKILDKGVSRRQKGNVFTWGYPYVGRDYIFHMTLTTILAPHELDVWRAKVIELGAQYLTAPAIIRDLTVFAQKEPDAPFEVLRRFPLLGNGE